MPQPDLCMFIDPARGGQATVSEDGYIEGGPELVVEVSSSTVSIDLHTKLRVYRRNKVREYVVWRVVNRAIDWFVLREGEYVKLSPGEDGIYRSEVFPGLWLDPKALIDKNLAGVLGVLAQGLASPEHTDFVARLNPSDGLSATLQRFASARHTVPVSRSKTWSAERTLHGPPTSERSIHGPELDLKAKNQRRGHHQPDLRPARLHPVRDGPGGLDPGDRGDQENQRSHDHGPGDGHRRPGPGMSQHRRVGDLHGDPGRRDLRLPQAGGTGSSDRGAVHPGCERGQD